MTEIICLETKHSTTRRLTGERPLLKHRSEDKFESTLFLPQGEDQQSEGGLRTQGYFKNSTDDKPLISIITIVYNGEQYLEETILSVINQTYDNVEYIIIDGRSTDGTLDIIKKYEKKIDYWVSEKDSGISDAFNKGVLLSTGKLIGIINSDDYYEEYSFRELINAYDNNQKKETIYYGKTYKITVDNKKIVKKDNKNSWCLCVPFSHCSSFLTRGYYNKHGLFNKNFKIAMDVELLMRGLNSETYKEINFFMATQRDGGVSDINRIKGYKEYIKASRGSCSFFKSYIYYLIKVSMAYKNKVLK